MPPLDVHSSTHYLALEKKNEHFMLECFSRKASQNRSPAVLRRRTHHPPHQEQYQTRPAAHFHSVADMLMSPNLSETAITGYTLVSNLLTC